MDDFFSNKGKEKTVNKSVSDEDENEKRPEDSHDTNEGNKETNDKSKAKDVKIKIDSARNSKKKERKSGKSSAKNIRTKESKPVMLMPLNEKREMELLRRFNVRINNIRIQNLQPDALTVYLQITIGGDYKEDFIITEGGRKISALAGSRGPTAKTELMRGIEKDQIRSFGLNFECEYRGSYFMLQEEKFDIEIWSYSKWTLNQYLGKFSTSLAKIAGGNVHRNDLVIKQDDRKALCRLYYTAYFQEIWDFNLTFTDWRVSDLLMNASKTFEMNPQLSLILQTNEITKPKVSTNEARREDRTPYWDKLSGSMAFRGTIDDLESQNLRIILYDSRALSVVSSTLVDRTVPLKGVVDFGILKTSVNLGKPKVSKKEKQKAKTLNELIEGNNEADRPSVNQRKTHTTHHDDDDDDAHESKLFDPNDENLRDESLQIQIEGRISCGNIPRYRQRGELIRLKSTSRYIAINVQRVEKISVPETRATINTYMTVEWGGQIKRSGIQYDNHQPIFNEEFYFEIPVKKNKSAFNFGSSTNDYLQQLRSELQTNNCITVDLWLEGEDGTSDNLGNTTFTISELQNAPKEPKTYLDVVTNREIKYVSRVLETKKMMQSANDQTMQAQLLLQCWFLTDMPEEVDLRAYSAIQEDKFPIEIDFKVRSKKIEDNWNHAINTNFVRTPLEGFRQKNMKKFLVQDQYGKPHFLSKYVAKFTLEDYDFNNEDMTQKDKEDRKIQALGELAHYVRCIPFKTEGKNTEIWHAPNFLPIMKKGDVQEHALFMACLFMGCKGKEEEDSDDDDLSDEEIKKNYDSKDIKYPLIENRVFVCVGTSWTTKSTHYWVMTFNKRCDTITFWEPTTNQKYKLRGRIDKHEQYKLRFYLNSKTGQKLGKKEGGLIQNAFNIFKGFGRKTNGPDNAGNPGNAEEDTGDSRKTNEKQSHKNKDKDKDKNKQRNTNQRHVVIKEDDEDDHNHDKDVYVEDDMVNIISEKVIKMEDVSLKVRATTQTRSTFLHNLKREMEQEAEHQNNNTDGNNRADGSQKTFIERRKEQEANEELKDDDKHHKAILKFYNKNDEVLPTLHLPFSSIELIFNHKNVWANMQFFNPAKIMYHLHNIKEWNPYLYIDDDVPLEERTPWLSQVGTFYTFKSMGPPLREVEVKKIKEDILKAVNFGITAARSGKNLQTLWKKPKDRIVKHLEEDLRLLEKREKEVLTLTEYDEEKAKWQKTLRSLMPANYRYRALPMFFTYSEGERIKSTIVKQAAEFYMVEEDQCLFALACKIFPYPGLFNSVRTTLAIFFPIPEDEISDEDSPRNISEINSEQDYEEEGLLAELDL